VVKDDKVDRELKKDWMMQDVNGNRLEVKVKIF